MWKNLTKEDLDKAYNNSLAVSNSPTIVQGWADSSALAKVQLHGECDIMVNPSFNYLITFLQKIILRSSFLCMVDFGKCAPKMTLPLLFQH